MLAKSLILAACAVALGALVVKCLLQCHLIGRDSTLSPRANPGAHPGANPGDKRD